jgi:hypothetical protein
VVAVSLDGKLNVEKNESKLFPDGEIKIKLCRACTIKPFTREVLLKGRLSTDELPVLTSLDQHIFT